MLFDLSSPGRKTAVRIIFGFLAFIFATGFIFLGIGTEGGFNPFDSAGERLDRRGASSSRSRTPRRRSTQTPNDPEPLVEPDRPPRAVRRRASSRSTRTTEQPIALTEESRAEFEEAISLWQDYLDAGAARRSMLRPPARSFSPIASSATSRARSRPQRALAKSDPSAPNFGALATSSTSTSRSRKRTRRAIRRSPRRTARPSNSSSSSSSSRSESRRSRPRSEQKKQPKSEHRREPRAVRSVRRAQRPTDPAASGPLTLATIEGFRAVSSAGRAGDS